MQLDSGSEAGTTGNACRLPNLTEGIYQGVVRGSLYFQLLFSFFPLPFSLPKAFYIYVGNGVFFAKKIKILKRKFKGENGMENFCQYGPRWYNIPNGYDSAASKKNNLLL
jgi:hypothetical protein